MRGDHPRRGCAGADRAPTERGAGRRARRRRSAGFRSSPSSSRPWPSSSRSSSCGRSTPRGRSRRPSGGRTLPQLLPVAARSAALLLLPAAVAWATPDRARRNRLAVAGCARRRDRPAPALPRPRGNQLGVRLVRGRRRPQARRCHVFASLAASVPAGPRLDHRDLGARRRPQGRRRPVIDGTARCPRRRGRPRVAPAHPVPDGGLPARSAGRGEPGVVRAECPVPVRQRVARRPCRRGGAQRCEARRRVACRRGGRGCRVGAAKPHATSRCW